MGFPADSQVVRITVVVPPDRVTGGQQATIPLVCHSSDTIDAVKRILTYHIRDLFGRRPPITVLNTLSPVHFLRTAPDRDGKSSLPGESDGLIARPAKHWQPRARLSRA